MRGSSPGLGASRLVFLRKVKSGHSLRSLSQNYRGTHQLAVLWSPFILPGGAGAGAHERPRRPDHARMAADERPCVSKLFPPLSRYSLFLSYPPRSCQNFAVPLRVLFKTVILRKGGGNLPAVYLRQEARST